MTTNQKKFESLSKLLTPLGIRLFQLSYEFDEGRELNIESVTRSKLAQAKREFPNKKLIVDDRGFFIPALGGFPGPFVKLLLDSFSYRGITKLMRGETDRRAIFSYAIGYYDGEEDIVLSADEIGFITTRAKGKNLHGWTELLYIYGHPSSPNKSLAQLNDNEWEQYLAAIQDVDPFAKLRDYLQR